MTNQDELMIRVVAMPADTNSSGDIFGGWLMSQMDLAAWICAVNIIDGVNSIIWAGRVGVVAPVWCDISKWGKVLLRFELLSWNFTLFSNQNSTGRYYGAAGMLPLYLFPPGKNRLCSAVAITFHWKNSTYNL